MSVTRRDVQNVAHLARLRLSDEDLERMTRDLNDILEHVDALAGLGGEAPWEAGEHVPPGSGATRQAEATPERAHFEPATDGAPHFRDGFFLVPPPPGVHEEPEAT